MGRAAGRIADKRNRRVSGKYCLAGGPGLVSCTYSSLTPGISIHLFPSNESGRRKLTKFVQKHWPGFKPTKISVLCSVPFTPENVSRRIDLADQPSVLKLKYSERLINCTITRFIESQDRKQTLDIQVNKPDRIILPIKDQRSADLVRRQLSDLAKKINSDLRPMFTSKKIADEIKVTEPKPPLVNEQCVVY